MSESTDAEFTYTKLPDAEFTGVELSNAKSYNDTHLQFPSVTAICGHKP